MRWVANRFGTMRLNRLLLLLASAAICFHGAPAQAAMNGRLALSCDGNFRDHDDINSSAWELAMCAKAGRVADLVYFGYADHCWKNDPTMESQMTTSVTTAVNDWGYSPSVIHNAHADPTAAVNALSAAINVSTASNPLTIMEAAFGVGWSDGSDVIWTSLLSSPLAARAGADTRRACLRPEGSARLPSRSLGSGLGRRQYRVSSALR
jgi:hypothetical protein